MIFLLFKIYCKKILGEIHYVEAHYHRYRLQPQLNAWREKDLPGSVILYDLGSHLIDQAICLFGLPIELYATVEKQLPHSIIDDYFHIILYYPHSLKVVLTSSKNTFPMSARYQVFGKKGILIKYGEDVQEEHLKAGDFHIQQSTWGREEINPQCLLHILQSDDSLLSQSYPILRETIKKIV